MFDGGEKENPSREDPLPHRHHTGDVIIEGDDVYGDGVNVAARLEDLARPGGISVAWPAYHQFMGKLPAGFGAQEVKNIAERSRLGALVLEQIHAAQVVREGRRPVASLGASALVLLLILAGGIWWVSTPRLVRGRPRPRACRSWS